VVRFILETINKINEAFWTRGNLWDIVLCLCASFYSDLQYDFFSDMKYDSLFYSDMQYDFFFYSDLQYDLDVLPCTFFIFLGICKLLYMVVCLYALGLLY